eukprot:1861706-Pleurochrysis_carterae.AAC.1
MRACTLGFPSFSCCGHAVRTQVVSGNARAREEYSLPDEVVVANSLEAALEALGQDTMREEARAIH